MGSKPIRHFSGIDAFKIVAMLMVVMLHFLGHGGILDSTSQFSAHYYVLWLLEILCYSAVDCFALISGYLCLYAKNRYGKLIDLWMWILFYSLGLTIVFFVISGGDALGIKDWLRALFPVTHKTYWYISAYFGMFLLVPFLNIIIKNATKKQLIHCGLAIFMFMSVVPTIFGTDPFGLKFGYSVIWLSFLYLLGAFYRMYEDSFKPSKRMGLILFASSVAFTYLYKLFIELVLNNTMGLSLNGNAFVRYSSPSVALMGLGLLMYFSQVNIHTTWIQKQISRAGKASLAVYLLQDHPLVRKFIINDSTIMMLDYSIPVILFMLASTTLLCYILFTLIEYVRVWIFDKLNVWAFCRNIENKLAKVLGGV